MRYLKNRSDIDLKVGSRNASLSRKQLLTVPRYNIYFGYFNLSRFLIQRILDMTNKFPQSFPLRTLVNQGFTAGIAYYKPEKQKT